MRFTQKRYWAVEFLLLGFIILSLTGDLCKAAEEKFPSRQITYLVGYGPGGAADLPARGLAEEASKILGQPVVVVNKPGAGGAVALGELKNAKPDGYTVSLMSSGAVISPHLRKVTYDPVKDFDAIIQYNVGNFGLVVRSDSPFKSFKDLISYAQNNPKKLKYGTAGAGTPQHLVMLQLAGDSNIQWVHIPFGSGMEAIAALMGGHLDMVAQSSEWKSHVLAGRLHLLVTFGTRRMDTFPDVPTLVELGYRSIEPSVAMLVGPKGMPQDRVKILHDAFRKAMEGSPFRKALEATDQVFAYKNTADTQSTIKEIYETTGRIIKENADAMK